MSRLVARGPADPEIEAQTQAREKIYAHEKGIILWAGVFWEIYFSLS